MATKRKLRTGNGIYCHLLTIADQHTRFPLTCHGLPRAIRTDSGVPLATPAIKPVQRTCAAQQRNFDALRIEYNEV